MSVAVRQIVPTWRYTLAIILLAALVSLLVWRVLALHVLDTERGHDFLQGQGDPRTIRREHIPGYRGVISDRNGEPLAVSTPVASIWVNPKHLISEQARWPELAKAVGMSHKALQKRLNSNSNDFICKGGK